jgi:hypothetical protein
MANNAEKQDQLPTVKPQLTKTIYVVSDGGYLLSKDRAAYGWVVETDTGEDVAKGAGRA